MKKSFYTKIWNALYPGYSECPKCGGNWGWKEWVAHSTSDSTWLSLFCVDCDKSVTPEERWEALDEWKKDYILQMSNYSFKEGFLEEVRKILDTEFIEYPR